MAKKQGGSGRQQQRDPQNVGNEPKPPKPVNVLNTKKGDESRLILDFNEHQEIITHLFILKTAQMKKYMGWKSDWEADIKADPQYMQAFDHQHSYRTMNSDGEFLDSAHPVGGHFHQCKIKVDEKTGKPALDENGHLQIEVSEAMTIAKGKPAAYPYDHHTHEAYYVRSNRIKVQQIAPEVIQRIGQLQSTYGLGIAPGVKIVG